MHVILGECNHGTPQHVSKGKPTWSKVTKYVWLQFWQLSCPIQGNPYLDWATLYRLDGVNLQKRRKKHEKNNKKQPRTVTPGGSTWKGSMKKSPLPWMSWFIMTP